VTDDAGASSRLDDAVIGEALGIDLRTDGVAIHDAGHLPGRLALYVPNLFVGIDGSAASTAVAELLEQVLPPTAPITLVMHREAGPELLTEDLARLRVITIDAATAVYVPAVDVRVEALGALYAADILHLEEIDDTQLSRRAASLAQGTWTDRATLDAAISEASRSWRVERMPAVDRNLLRLAAYELMHTDLPTGVILDEAVTLAKAYSTESSGRFVNGVLDTVAGARSDGAST
jgi:transcription antitermination factor NusB